MAKTHERSGSDAGAEYEVFETDDGEVVLYDRENPSAWIQSSYAIDVSGC